MKRLFFLLFLLFIDLNLSGCSLIKKPPTHIPYKDTITHRYVYFDPKFSGIEKQAIIDAFNAWTLASRGQLTFTIKDYPIVYSMENPCSKHLEVFRMTSKDQWVIDIQNKIGSGIRGYANRTNQMCGNENFVLVMDKITKIPELTYVSIHEIGHIFGFYHNQQYSIMNADHIDQIGTITNQDIKNLCLVISSISC